MKIVALTAFIAISLCIIAYRQHSKMKQSLPPIEEAHAAEINMMLIHGSPLCAIMGTGSMKPAIPEGEGIVAWALISYQIFSTLGEGDTVIYHANGKNIIHQLAKLTPTGWIAIGLANPSYDDTRVTAQNYMGRAVKIYVLTK